MVRIVPEVGNFPWIIYQVIQLPSIARVSELVRDGAIGELEEVHAWTNRLLHRPGYPAGTGRPPRHIDWDLWVGPSSFHPYSPSYFGAYNGKPGPNCLHWNVYWDFGGGQLADMGSHIMDIAWNAIDGDLPTSVVAEGGRELRGQPLMFGIALT